MSPILILTTMVRNESRALPRLLRSAAQVVTHVALTDTGSTDNTIEIAKDVCKELGLSLDVKVVPWKDFGFNRTKNLEHGREVASTTGNPESCYLLLLDADMEVPEGVKPLGAYPALGMLAQRDNQAVWWNARILKADVPAMYIGRTHEYLSHGQPTTPLDWFSIIDHCDGGCRADKFERDERLLRLDLAEKNDPRSMFYLAQTLKTLGRTKEALELYDKRSKFEDFPEEAWVARMEASRCTTGPEADMRALEAFFTRPFRSEPLAEMAMRASEAGKHKLALGLAVLGKPIPFPKSEVLYMTDHAYKWAFPYVEMISAFYVGDFELGLKACNYLQLTKGSPYVGAAIDNSIFYIKPIEGIKRPLPSVLPVGFAPASPCLLKVPEGWLGMIRGVNYTITPEGGFVLSSGYTMASALNPITTRNFVIRYDENFKMMGEPLELKSPKGVNPGAFIVGFEDQRIVSFRDNKLTTAGVRCDCHPTTTPEIWEAVWDMTDGQPLSVRRLSDGTRVEKNWLPFQGGYIYGHWPLTFLDKDGKNPRSLEADLDLSSFRGSSAPIPYKDGYLYLIHQVATRGRRVYIHRFVHVKDTAWTGMRISAPFRMARVNCMESCFSINDTLEGVVMSCAYEDREIYTLTVAHQTIERLFTEGSLS